jgi:hypothetical protein
MKTFKQSSSILIIIFILLVLSGCGAYKPTIIEQNLKSDLDSKSNYKKIAILCSYNSLKKVHDLTGAHKTAFARDQDLARAVVTDGLNSLCGNNQNCSQSCFVTINQGSITTDKYIDFKIYQFVNWVPVFIQILPTYYGCNESVCVTAEIYEGGKVVKRFEEWGFSKDRGFWFFPFGTKPKTVPLRNFVAKKVLNEALSSIN